VTSRRYAVDTNLYIDALRTAEGLAALKAFDARRTAYLVMSAVVAHELRAGVRTPAAIGQIEDGVIGPFERRGRLITPSFQAWKEGGRVLSSLVGKGEWSEVSRSLVNDVLMAMSCREAGVVLLTRNVRDFERIARVRKFDFVPPWP
jgi:predicted nucleic acid-binding protein